MGESPASVRGLPLPGLLIDMLAAGRWRHPGDDVVREVIPWFESPLVFLTSVGQMRSESQSLDLFADESRESELFRVSHAVTGRTSDGCAQVGGVSVWRAEVSLAAAHPRFAEGFVCVNTQARQSNRSGIQPVRLARSAGSMKSPSSCR